MLQPIEVTEKTRFRWRKLETISQVRHALALVMKRCFDGQLAPDVANACTNTLRALGKTIHDSELEKRVRELEQRLTQ